MFKADPMARILLATDFSDNAVHASEYAVGLFGPKVNTYSLLHTYVDLSLADPMVPSMAAELMKASEDGLRDHVDRFVRRTGAEGVRQEVRYGPLPAVINDIAREGNNDLVVIGNAGKTGSFFFGSNTISVLKHSHLPVLAVPAGAKVKTVERILLADDRGDILPGDLDMLRRIAQLSAAEVLVGHVEMPVNEGTSLESEGVYGPALAGVAHSYHHARGADVVDGLDRLARRKHVDLIAVLHRHIGLLAGMFHPSTAQELAQRIELPLLVLEQNMN